MKQKYEKSHLTHNINRLVHKTIRWCTPSIDLTFAQIKDQYASDISVSFESFGYPSEPSGIFKDVYEQAAEAYGADHTLFSVNGSTGSNAMILRALSKQIPKLRILAQRNVHKSIVTPCEDYRINLIFLEPNFDQDNQLFIPNTEEQIYEGIKKHKPNVLLLTNPTYDGICLDLKSVISTVRKNYPELIVYVDEAWGAHLHFSDKLPTSAMEAGADICVQSTHKQGGSLQQSGMIHWKEGRINNDLLLESYRSLSTTSPSYILLASLDAARETMQKRGKKKLNHMLTIAKRLSRGINHIDGFEVISTKYLKKNFPSVYERDETKVIVNVTQAGLTGYEVAHILEKKYKIIPEIYNIKTITFLIPFRATFGDVQSTISAIAKIAKKSKKMNTDTKTIEANLNFKTPTKIPRILELNKVTKLLGDQLEQVPLSEAAGRISAEDITPYPPGIPMTTKGEELTKEIVEYYLKLKTSPNFHIAARDKSMETVLVVSKIKLI